MTEQQHSKCKQYLEGKLTENDMYMLFKTYLNEYIDCFGWTSWKCDSIPTILTNMCKASVYTN